MGFELEKFSAVLKKNAGTSRFVSKKPEAALQSRCSCAVSYQFLQKHCIFNKIDHFRHFGHFDKIFDARSSLRFCALNSKHYRLRSFCFIAIPWGILDP